LVYTVENNKDEEFLINQFLIKQKLISNMEQLSFYLNILNPHYSKEKLVNYFIIYVNLLIEQIDALLVQDYVNDIKYFNENIENILSLADYLTYGLSV